MAFLMNLLHRATVLLMLSASFAQARTWTSADGSQTFEGDLRRYNAATEMVTVVVDGSPITFPTLRLSEGDLAFLKEHEENLSKSDPTEASEERLVETQVRKAKLHRFDGKRFRRAELEEPPEYYFFYFSASWCAPCRSGAKKMVEKYEASVPENSTIAMIHISLDQDDEAANQWASEENFPWLTLLPGDRQRSDLMQYKTTNSVPEAIVYRANGELFAKGTKAAFELVGLDEED